MGIDLKKTERENKLRTLELKIRMRRFQKLKEELLKVRSYLLNDIERMEQTGHNLPDDLQEIKNELIRYS